MPGQKADYELIFAYRLFEIRRTVSDGTSMILEVCMFFQAKHPERFNALPKQFPIAKKQWFRDHNFDGYNVIRIPNSQVWLDANMNTRKKKKICKAVDAVLRLPGRIAENRIETLSKMILDLPHTLATAGSMPSAFTIAARSSATCTG